MASLRLSRAFISLLALTLVGCAARELAPRSTVPPSAQSLPDVTLTTLDGRAVRLEQVAAGRPALVSLWATWCDACLRELGALARLDAATRTTGGSVIAVSVGESPATVAGFARRHGLAWTQLVDEPLALSDALHLTRIPATLVLDGTGRIVYRGAAFDEAALAAFRALVEPARR